MSRYRQLQIFDSVARAGSLAGAARQLNVAPVTVLRGIQALEARLNCALLVRGPRGVRLSPAGERFAAACGRTLQDITLAERSVAGIHAQPAGHLTVALPLLMARASFTPVALAYLGAFPEVTLRLSFSDEPPRLHEEGIDAALVVGALPDSSGYAVSLGEAAFLICAAPSYLSQRGQPATPDDLPKHQTVLVARHDLTWRFQHAARSCKVRTRPVLTCSTQRGAVDAALAGLGLVRCLSFEVSRELERGQLLPVLTEFAPRALPIHLIYREGRKAPAHLRAFIDFAVPMLRACPAFAPQRVFTIQANEGKTDFNAVSPSAAIL